MEKWQTKQYKVLFDIIVWLFAKLCELHFRKLVPFRNLIYGSMSQSTYTEIIQ